jgi:fructose-bisphosphate aldolase class I
MSTLTELRNLAHSLVRPGTGILAIDESTGTCNKRFEKLGIEPTAENRRAYRELLLTTHGLGEFISGAILYDETLTQSTQEEEPFVQVMERGGIVPGIKVDTGTVALGDSPDEKVTEGLDGLANRVATYRLLGAMFAKWRAVIAIGTQLPTRTCLRVNAQRLARYAKICQDGGLVPIVEPEVLMDGPHTILECYDVTARTWDLVFRELQAESVALDAMVFKCSMVLAGDRCEQQHDVATVADMTLSCLLQNVPDTVAGIAFLSGGQSDRLATEHLNEINRRGGDAPWPLTFSYGRALQYPAIEIWRGNPDRVPQAQQALLLRARCNSAASVGQYSPAMEEPVAV